MKYLYQNSLFFHRNHQLLAWRFLWNLNFFHNKLLYIVKLIKNILHWLRILSSQFYILINFSVHQNINQEALKFFYHFETYLSLCKPGPILLALWLLETPLVASQQQQCAWASKLIKMLLLPLSPITPLNEDTW